MRTTIELNDDLFRRAKRQAVEEGETLRGVVESALRQYLVPQGKKPAYKFRWRTESGTIQPGVRLDDRDALFDLMDGR